MAIRLTFDPTDSADVKKILAFLDAAPTATAVAETAAATAVAETAVATAVAEMAEPKRKPGRPKKPDAPLAAPYVTPTPGVVAATMPPTPPEPKATALASDIADIDFGTGPTEATKVVDKEVMISAVRAFYGKHGKDKTAELLKRVGATSIGTVKPDDYGIIVKAAQL